MNYRGGNLSWGLFDSNHKKQFSVSSKFRRLGSHYYTLFLEGLGGGESLKGV